jgi:hypothetical protein
MNSAIDLEQSKSEISEDYVVFVIPVLRGEAAFYVGRRADCAVLGKGHPVVYGFRTYFEQKPKLKSRCGARHRFQESRLELTSQAT